MKPDPVPGLEWGYDMVHLSFHKNLLEGTAELFRTSGRKDFAVSPLQTPRHVEEEIEDPDTVICRQCLQLITQTDNKITVQGSHQHIFANPHGMLFTIGCFDRAQGCTISPVSYDEFTWFRGFSWSIAECSSCISHLGWYFSAPHNTGFFGLILDKLIFPET